MPVVTIVCGTLLVLMPQVHQSIAVANAAHAARGGWAAPIPTGPPRHATLGIGTGACMIALGIAGGLLGGRAAGSGAAGSPPTAP